uniref:Protein arginine methyltransferase NDUFAF7 n=1 Tax=Neogobius melanostomus TaxID=47308 RepID=A0A8C6SBI3_9GOBI
MCAGGVACVGPVSQSSFLRNMGIEARLQVLLRSSAGDASRAQLLRSYHMLTDPQQMGERFQFFGILPLSRVQEPRPQSGLTLEKNRRPAPLPVAGFSELTYS